MSRKSKMIKALAAASGVSRNEYRRGMREYIDKAWVQTTPYAYQLREQCPMTGEKPSVEEFVTYMPTFAQDRMRPLRVR